MRSILAALLATTTFVLSACGGPQQAPLVSPPPPVPDTAPVAPAPSDSAPPAPAPKPALSELIESSLKATREGFEAHDAARMATAVTEDVAVFDYGVGETHGKADFQSAMAQIFSLVGDARLATNRVWKKGNVVITELTWTGTMSGDVMGLKATHQPVGQMRLNVYWFNDDGLIKELHEYADDAGLMAQMQRKKGAPPVPVLPTNPPEVHLAIGTAEPGKLADWAKGLDDAFNKDDGRVVVAGLADDADYWLNTTGTPAIKGKKALGKELQAFFKAFPDQQWTTTNAWDIDGFGILEHRMTGTFKGPFGPVRPTGKTVTAWHQVDIMQPAADGKLQHGWGYANSVEMLAQAGALPLGPAEKSANVQAEGGRGTLPKK